MKKQLLFFSALTFACFSDAALASQAVNPKCDVRRAGAHSLPFNEAQRQSVSDIIHLAQTNPKFNLTSDRVKELGKVGKMLRTACEAARVLKERRVSPLGGEYSSEVKKYVQLFRYNMQPVII